MSWNSCAGRATATVVACLVTTSALAEDSPRVVTFQDCDVCPVMAIVPPGSFQMGSSAAEIARMDEETPVHKVTFAQPFAMGVEDCWHENYQDAPADGSARTARRCRQRVLRGGGWANSPGGLRSAMRIPNGAGVDSDIVGFRVARSLSPQEIDEHVSR